MSYPAPAGKTYGSALAPVIVACLFILTIGTLGSNFDLAALAAAVLAVGVACLWRPGEPPTMLFVFGFQWLQASVAIGLATSAQQPLDDYFHDAGPVGEATALTLCALAAMAIGMRLGAGRNRHDLQEQAHLSVSVRPMRDWFYLYVTAWFFGAAALVAAQFVSGLAQILGGVNALRWAFFFLLGVAHFSRGARAGWWFPLAFAFEFSMGIGGYFSDFKTVFIVTFLAMTMSGARLSASRLASLVAVGLAAFAAGVVWTAIKPEYRQFVSGGEDSQVVSVGYPEQVQKLGELISTLDDKSLVQGANDLLARLSYVEFFASTLAYVPSQAPHENGAILLDAVTRPFTPRLLFPDKPEINDSDRTRLYTGRYVAGSESGTSISLGWAAELYIDFGSWGMMLVAAAIGAFYGFIQRALTLWPRSRGLLGYAAASSVLIAAALLESSITKVIGGVMAALLAAVVVIGFLVPLWCPWLVRKSP